MKVCKKCGFENLDDANFCANCQNDLNLEGGEILNKNAQDVSSSVNEAQEKIQVNTPLNDLRRQKSIMGLTLAAFFAQGMISGKINQSGSENVLIAFIPLILFILVYILFYFNISKVTKIFKENSIDDLAHKLKYVKLFFTLYLVVTIILYALAFLLGILGVWLNFNIEPLLKVLGFGEIVMIVLGVVLKIYALVYWCKSNTKLVELIKISEALK